MRIDALIGLDVLQRASFRVDYRAKHIFFGRLEPLPYSAPFEWTSGLLTVDLQSGASTLRLLVDTGAQSTLLLGSHLSLTRQGGNREFTNLGGNFSLREVKLENVQLGDVDLGSQPVFVSDSRDLPAYPFDGFLSTIQFEQIAFDFERRIFSWMTRDSRDRRVHLAQRTGSLTPNLSGLSAGLADADASFLGRIP